MGSALGMMCATYNFEIQLIKFQIIIYLGGSMKKKIIFILISGLFLIFPVISQAYLLITQEPALTTAVIITDAYGNPESIEITGIFSDDCTQIMYDQVTEMENTLLIQIFLESSSPFCAQSYLPFTHVVEIDSIPEGSSITIGLYNGTSAIDGVVEVFGDPLVIAGINNEGTEPEEIFINIMPETLNLKSNGRFVTVSIELPEEYDNENMTLESARIDDEIKAEKMFLKKDIFIAKFNRDEVIEFLSAMGIDLPTKVELGLEFGFSGDNGLLTVKAIDTIKVVTKNSGGKKEKKRKKALKMNK